jgi:rhodanese-related sulfurtransferase
MDDLIAAGAGGENLVVPLDEALALHGAGVAVFLDARPEEAFNSGHVAGARNLPWQDFDARFPEIMEAIPPDAFIITYCDGEACSLSKDLALALRNMGYTQVRVLVNGWSVWKDEGLPTEP